MKIDLTEKQKNNFFNLRQKLETTELNIEFSKEELMKLEELSEKDDIIRKLYQKIESNIIKQRIKKYWVIICKYAEYNIEVFDCENGNTFFQSSKEYGKLPMNYDRVCTWDENFENNSIKIYIL